MRLLNLFVGGMSCRRCVREATARLRDVPGVVTVSADATRSVIQLSGSMEISDVLAALRDTSYAASLLPIAATTRDHDGHPDRATESGQTDDRGSYQSSRTATPAD